jgi:hypothetical protein
MLDVDIKSNISKFDCIIFNASSGRSMGMVIEGYLDNVDVIICKRMSSEVSQQHALSPITATEYPMAHHGNMVEVYASMSDWVSVPRASILDIVFIVPINEVESGMFHIAGSRSAFFTRYYMDSDGTISKCNNVFYFERYFVEPFSHRIFSALNYLAQNLKRVMYHLKESDASSKSFRMFFSAEAFAFVCNKVPSAILATTARNESSIVYYNTLQMESRTNLVTKTYLRILNRRSLLELRQLLGDGTGLGLSVGRPNKRCKVKYCIVNGKLNSVEVGENIPIENVDNLSMQSRKNGIDFLYSEEMRLLTCNVRFTSITVSTPEVARSRIPCADVKQPATSVYVGAWFLYNGVVQEVVSVSGDVVSCKNPDDDDDDVLLQLPTLLVSELINSFGR